MPTKLSTEVKSVQNTTGDGTRESYLCDDCGQIFHRVVATGVTVVCPKCSSRNVMSQGDMGNTSNGSWPMSMKCSFIEPGIVRYADVGDVYVGKEALDKMMNSFIGRPVVNEDHREVSPEDFAKGTAQGIVNSVWYDPKDAMFHAGYQVWDQPTLKNIRGGFKVSCAYKVTKWGPGGIHNNVPYEREVLDGEYTHLAIVANPRYEGVRIYNNKGAKTMTLNWIKKILGTDGKEIENSVEIESSKSKVEIDGKDVPMDDLVNAFKEQEEKKAAAALANQSPKLTDIITIDGKKVTIADLMNAYKMKNEEEKAEKDRKKSEEEEKERDNAARQIRNEMDKDHKEGKHEDAEKENCAMCNELKNNNGRTHFERVDSLANNRKGEMTDELPAHYDGLAEGQKRFGTEPAAK